MVSKKKDGNHFDSTNVVGLRNDLCSGIMGLLSLYSSVWPVLGIRKITVSKTQVT
jgi:hypothetical protein